MLNFVCEACATGSHHVCANVFYEDEQSGGLNKRKAVASTHCDCQHRTPALKKVRATVL